MSPALGHAKSQLLPGFSRRSKYLVAGGCAQMLDTLPTHPPKSAVTAVSGGAFLHSGVTRGLYATTFVENKAGEAGPAVMSLGIAENMSDVVFDGNTFHCEVGEFGSDISELEDEVGMTSICKYTRLPRRRRGIGVVPKRNINSFRVAVESVQREVFS